MIILPEKFELVPSTDPILTTMIPEFDFQNPVVDSIEFAKKLAATMMEKGGAGLAANQCGYSVRAFAMRTNPIVVCYNPKIVDRSDEVVKLDEGCLTYPGLIVPITRSRRIRVRFALPNGEIRTEVYHDLTARTFQHELGHLNGERFYQRASKFHLEIARNKVNRRKRRIGQ